MTTRPWGVIDDVDSAQREVRHASLENLALERVETVGLRAVRGPYDLSGLVAHAEDEPCGVHSSEVRLIAERRDISAEPVCIEVASCLLELDGLILPVGDELFDKLYVLPV